MSTQNSFVIFTGVVLIAFVVVPTWGQDSWFDLFQAFNKVNYQCSRGPGEYANSKYPDRFYTCELENNVLIMKLERVCPPASCYNSSHPFKCSTCPKNTNIPADPYHPCSEERGEDPQFHPEDPTVFYNCQKSSSGALYYHRQMRCTHSNCFTGNPKWPCGSGLDFCPIRNSSSTVQPQPDGPEQMTCLKRQTEVADAELACKDETLALLQNDLGTFISSTAHRGDQYQNFLMSIRDVHLDMRENYAKLIYATGRNIFPRIIATECDNPELCGVGGTYKLYLRDGSMHRMPRVAPEFEAYKSLSHIALGVFSIISPYFRSPQSSSWIPLLSTFLGKLQATIHSLEKTSNVGLTERYLATKMLNLAEDYVNTAIQNKYVDSEGYHEFAVKLAPFIDRCMQEASKMQAGHILPNLKKWKKELGPEEWRKTYVIITTVWPVSKINVRLQMFEQVMEFEQIKQQVLIVEGGRNEDDALTTLGRIVADRALGLLVFGGLEEEDMKDHAFSISTRRDLLSTQAGRAIEEHCERVKESCPMRKAFATMTK